ncbi:glycosyltransferase involved in cell wall biosynthesis [Dysgonomonas sp. PH5-45]|uniref:glycosyltransferase family 2 protein n=1 Tax=unclassified Dysgonomonas TaxID=2630389 RepID=UPI002472EF9E|nr:MULTISPECIES: glycosyltransferase family 2 protein [unclassified Dysgonomonas]MDH6355302.1 glycosyltransferase involved in cell wall biosynthesis [Dysgonomonas sp. PH5-45]MDH6388172.1 glycosyltransferase involved in cell wall biosynthesis [Dysgonomonas sp. PH5-37]
MAKLSVITINLNDKNGLQKTINSLMCQTYQDFDFYVIDGGSTDGSVDVIKQYENRITYWVSEPDRGIYNAMNKAIAKAEGEYCYFLNSGDYLVNETVFESVFKGDPHESFICGNFYYEENGVRTHQTEYRERDWAFALYDIYSGYLCHQAFFIRTDNFRKYGLYSEEYKILSDWKLFLEAIGVNHEAVRYVDTDIVVYNLGGISYTIGGKAIYKEKVKIAENVLSPYLFKKLNRLYYLQRNDFYVDFIFSRKWITFIIKCFMKACYVLKISKP